MIAAPIWHKPTPCPHPLPTSRNIISPLSLIIFSASNAELYKWLSLSNRRMLSSLPITIFPLLPSTSSSTILPDGPRFEAFRLMTSPIATLNFVMRFRFTSEAETSVVQAKKSSVSASKSLRIVWIIFYALKLFLMI